jgi:quercetin dioxygenase-like cupin family protein
MAASEKARGFWFLDSLAYIRVSERDGHDGISVIEFLGPQGSSPPLHVHHDEDEVFHIIDGKLRVLGDGRERILTHGDTAINPRGKPHTYRIESETARFLVVTRNGLFERFVRAMSRPADGERIPERSGPPTPEQIQILTETAKRHAIEIVGPPLN